MNHDGLRAMATRLRIHSIRSTTQAGSGHPTSCLSAADVVSVLFFRVMRFDPKNPANPGNDRFVLSKGHAAPLLYAAWAEAGAFPADRLLTLRRIDSDLEGHPTPRAEFVDVGTGSLGQGLSVGVGMALAARLDGLDYRVYVLLGDGEVAEGAVWEAAAYAGHKNLDNLVAIVDGNRLGQSQETMFGHNLAALEQRYAASGWKTIAIDGHSIEAIEEAFEAALREKGRPTVILARTIKGKGVSFLEDRDGWHGKPLSSAEMEKALGELGDGKLAPGAFTPRLPPQAKPPAGPPSRPAPRAYDRGSAIATREAYGNALVRLGATDPRIVALDGDTKNSTFSGKFLEAYPDRFFECFIAEQNMVGTAVGLACRGKIPFASTFGAFFARAYDQIRMAGISRANIKLAGSHAGISIGEDGPSQMGLEDLAMMRAVPGCVVLYPSDGVSAEAMVELAAGTRGMVYIRTSRPKTPILYENHETFTIGGSKVVRSSDRDRLAIVAAGVTVHEAIKACEDLAREGIAVRVIDAYSVKPIDAKGIAEAAGDAGETVIVVEDHYPEGGIGEAVLSALAGSSISVHHLAVNDLPRSGKPGELLETYGIGAKRIAEKVKAVL